MISLNIKRSDFVLTFVCVFERYIFRDENSGYSIFTCQANGYNEYKNQYGFLCFEGNVTRYTKGVPLKITGTVVYKSNKITIKVTDIEPFTDDVEIAISYLTGGMFKGIGRKTAEQIIDTVGIDIFSAFKRTDIVDILSKRFSETKLAKIQAIIDKIRDNSYQLDVYKYISSFGGTYNNALTLVSQCGHDALNILKNSPYIAGRKAGMSFVVCDAIARDNEIHPYNEHRIIALLFEAFRVVGNRGSTHSTLEELCKIVNDIVLKSAYEDIIPAVNILFSLKKCKAFKTIDSSVEKYALYSLWEHESEAAKNLNRLKFTSYSLPFHHEYVAEIENKLNISYSSAQKRAFNLLMSTGVKVITGGPGTGKSTLINGLITAYKNINPSGRISLCAPTGKAAQRLTETTGITACTIHRLLEFMPYNNEYVYKTLSNPIDADFIIVDEMSMVDTELFSMLMGAIKNGSLLLLCGDVDQLPSVGPGNVLLDIMNSNKFETYKLDVVFRQGLLSSIVLNAEKIKSGLLNLHINQDFEATYVKSDSGIAKQISKIVDECILKNIPVPQILTPYNKGEAGTFKLNQLVQEKINPLKQGIHFGQYLFAAGDKIMTTKNNYSLNYFNGDTGIIKSVEDNGEIIISINDEEIIITPDLYDDLALAYSVSIHKSQGAEYDHVVVVVPEEFKGTLQRNLIYTAITRAKRKVSLIYTRDSLTSAVANSQTLNRKTLLYNLLNEVI